MLKFALILVLCIGAFAQVPGVGKCPKLRAVQNFDLEPGLGTWYVIGKYMNVVSTMTSKCQKSEYSLNDDGSIDIKSTHILTITGQVINNTGLAKPKGEKGEAKFSVVIDTKPLKFTGTVLILDTDYSNYAVGFACKEYTGLVNEKSAWILTRDRNPSDDILNHVNQLLVLNNLNPNFILRINQDDCKN